MWDKKNKKTVLQTSKFYLYLIQIQQELCSHWNIKNIFLGRCPALILFYFFFYLIYLFKMSFVLCRMNIKLYFIATKWYYLADSVVHFPRPFRIIYTMSQISKGAWEHKAPPLYLYTNRSKYKHESTENHSKCRSFIFIFFP